MAKIQTYTADNLPSARTQVAPPDTSGQELGKAISGFASNAFDVFQQEQQRQLKVDASIAESDYSVLMAEKEANILNPPEGQPAIKSKDIEAAYLAASTEARSQIIGKYSDGATRQTVDLVLRGSEGKYKVRAIKQKFEMDKVERLNELFGTAEKQVQSSYVDEETYSRQVTAINNLKQSLIDKGYSLPDATKFIQNTLDQKVQYAVDDAIDKGNEGSIYLAYNSGVFASASTERRDKIGKQISEALATKTYRAELKTQASALKMSVDMAAEYGSMDLKTMTHKLSSMEFELSEGEKNKSLSAPQIANLAKTINYVETLRKSKLNMAYVQAKYDDPGRKEEILKKLATAIQGSGRAAKKRPEVTYDELLDVRDDLLKAFVDEGSISRKTFEEYNADLLGAVSKGFTDEVFQGHWLNFGGPSDKVKRGYAEEDQNNVMALFKAAEKPGGGHDAVAMQYIFEEYLYDKRNSQTPIKITPEIARNYARRGWLSRNGYGTDYKVGSYLNTKHGSWKILDIGPFGVPIFDVPQEFVDKINQVKLEKKNAGNKR